MPAAITNPILLEVPESFDTARLTLRMPKPGDGAALHVAIVESYTNLQPWLRWAATMPTLEDTELRVRKDHLNYLAREDFRILMFLKGTDTLVGGGGLILRNLEYWKIPKFEIGYWVRTSLEGQGYISEAVAGLTKFGFEVLGAKRIEIKCDELNVRSRKVAERNGYTSEGLLVNDGRNNNGDLYNLMIFAQTR
jgi:RimJ/RimL family protein N-acetyltransferase